MTMINVTAKSDKKITASLAQFNNQLHGNIQYIQKQPRLKIKIMIFIAMQPVKVEMIHKTIIQHYKIPNNTNCITLIVTQ